MKHRPKLDRLPKSDDEYWAHADTTLHEMYGPNQCDHRFTGTGKGVEVECRCGVGFILSPGMRVKDGHIYKGDELVI